MGNLYYEVLTDGLSGTVNGVNIYTGPAGIAEPVSVYLTTSVSGNKIS